MFIFIKNKLILFQTVEDYDAFVKPLPWMPVGADGLTVVPAIEMTAFFSRIIVFWLINFILLGVVIQECVSLKRKTPTSAFVEVIRHNTIF